MKFLAPETEGEFLFEIEGYNRMWAGPPYLMIKLDVANLSLIIIIVVLVVLSVMFGSIKYLAKEKMVINP